MQIGEAILLDVGKSVVSDECIFEHDIAEQVRNNLDGSSSALGAQLESGASTQLWGYNAKNAVIGRQQKNTVGKLDLSPTTSYEVSVTHNGSSEQYPYSYSAHHLIPDDSALMKGENKLLEYIRAGSTIESDIGYDVNGSDNGLWLPMITALANQMSAAASNNSQARSVPGVDAERYAALKKTATGRSFLQKYTRAIMDRSRRQLHGWNKHHRDYSQFVVKCLNKVHQAIHEVEFECSMCNDTRGGSKPHAPPHRLVWRLNFISKRLHRHLIGDASSWRKPLFVSSDAYEYAVEKQPLLQDDP
ncbi:AHH domain-containing protein [Sorangium sp. So ce1389]|uniref:AHH domain-containing protein n=1 Tax=Sorangium sp. So ce1389 TaxID=3133336 RepID=UPI003F5EF44C